MEDPSGPRIRKIRLSRRDFLKVGGLGGLALAGGKVISVLAREKEVTLPARINMSTLADPPPPVTIRLAATDGHISLPGRDPLYVFGFVQVPIGASVDDLDVYKGNVRLPSPIIGMDELADVYLTLTNIGLTFRPDLDDSHTIHWHGFPNQNAIFDGVPELSIAVPVARDFPYFYRPRRVGTFMYHCHFEDTEHVQMGMDGVIFVRPSQNGTPIGGFTQFAYNDIDGSTGYDREFTLLLNEIDPHPHDGLEAVQEFIWSDYKASFWVINGRAYPDTLLPNNDASLPSQPVSSLIQVRESERVLLRFANLGYEQHAIQLPGISMRVVGEDAALLHSPDGLTDLSYWANTVYIGPGEARDVIFTAPAYSLAAAVTDLSGPYVATGPYNRYLLKNRNYQRQTNGGQPGMGGMVTEVRVYPASNTSVTLPQLHPNQTYPEFAPPVSPPYFNPWIT